MTVSISAASRGFEFDWRRYLPAIALVAGLAWLGLGLESIIGPEREDYRNTLIMVPWLTTMAVVYGIHDRHRGFGSRMERWGARILLGAMALSAISQPAFIFHNDILLPFAIAGFIGFLGGTVLFGDALYRLGVIPRALAAGIAATQAGTMATGLALSPWVPLQDDGSYSGAVFHGVVFTALAVWLIRVQTANGERRKWPARRPAD